MFSDFGKFSWVNLFYILCLKLLIVPLSPLARLQSIIFAKDSANSLGKFLNMADSREISEVEIAGHNTKTDLWLVIHGKGVALNHCNVQLIIYLISLWRYKVSRRSSRRCTGANRSCWPRCNCCIWRCWTLGRFERDNGTIYRWKGNGLSGKFYWRQ